MNYDWQDYLDYGVIKGDAQIEQDLLDQERTLKYPEEPWGPGTKYDTPEAITKELISRSLECLNKKDIYGYCYWAKQLDYYLTSTMYGSIQNMMSERWGME